MGELPKRSPEPRRRDLLSSDLLRSKSAEVPPTTETSEINIEVNKRRKAFGSNLNMQERSNESDEEEKSGTFDENPKQKIKFQNNKHTEGREASKLLRPLGTECFSESFHAASH